MSEGWHTEFADIIEGNAKFASTFLSEQRSGSAARGLAVVTCMDSRLDPLGALGLVRGDAKILRNPGARVTEEVIVGLVLSVYLLDVTRVLILPHTDCRMAQGVPSDIYGAVARDWGVDISSLAISMVTDQHAALKADIERVRACALLPADLIVDGALYDVQSGRLVHS